MMAEKAQERISIIVPVYCAGKSLESCVDSILASEDVQTEIILIDDGSTDGSGKLCDRLASEHDNIRVIHQENRGVSCARNEGLRAASGDYITFVDADDAIDPGMLAFLLEMIHRDGSSIAGCAVRRTTVPASVPEKEEIPAGSDVYTGEEYL
ncbi:MAG: glycosyltransferase, partial [Lachnospiraceae bacterium]|nr:glycosyltransferase [Lachnospiraceae bacterium]